LDLSPENAEVLSIKACILTEYAKSTNQSKALLNEAIQLFERVREPEVDAQVDYNIGNGYEGLGDYPKALESWDRALSQAPSRKLAASIYVNRGNVFDKIGKAHLAIRSYRKALQLHPNKWQAYAGWASIESGRARYKRVVVLLTRCFNTNPHLEQYGEDQIYVLAASLFHLGHLSESYKWVKKLNRIKPDDEQAIDLKIHLLSQLWRDNEQYIPEALAFFQLAHNEKPEEMVYRGEIYDLLRKTGRDEEAKELLIESLQFENVPPRVLYEHAKMLDNEGKSKEAIQQLEMALQADQSHYLTHFMANLKHRAALYEDALHYYRLALESSTTCTVVLSEIAGCNYMAGNFRASVLFSIKAIMVEPRRIEFWYLLTDSLRRLDNHRIMPLFEWFLYELASEEEIEDAYAEKVCALLLSNVEEFFGHAFAQQITSGIDY